MVILNNIPNKTLVPTTNRNNISIGRIKYGFPAGIEYLQGSQQPIRYDFILTFVGLSIYAGYIHPLSGNYLLKTEGTTPNEALRSLYEALKERGLNKR